MILIFWIKLTQKGYFWSKTEKVNITLHSSNPPSFKGEEQILITSPGGEDSEKLKKGGGSMV